MEKVKFTTRQEIGIGKNKCLRFQKYKGKYSVTILDRSANTYEKSKDYNTKQGLNNFLKKYDIGIITENEKE